MRSVAVAVLLHDDIDEEKRASVRRAVGMNVRVMRPQLRRDGATVTNLSIYGCRIEALRAVPGELVGLKFDTLSTIPARVAWVEDNVVGCEFETPLHPAVLDHLVASYAPIGVARERR
jgi:hypothetical protein